MERFNFILFSKACRDYLLQNDNAEKEREFCRHGFEHALNVARIAYILLLEKGDTFISKEIVYTAALLHDTGRYQENLDETDHAQAGARLAGPLLAKAGFDSGETNMIIKAIEQHRDKESEVSKRSPLSLAIAEADSYSRLCYSCKVKGRCKKFKGRPHKEGLLY